MSRNSRQVSRVVRVAESVAGRDPAGAFRRSGPRFALRTPWDEELPEAVRSRLTKPRVPLDWQSKSADDPVEGAGRLGRRPDRTERGERSFPIILALVDLGCALSVAASGSRGSENGTASPSQNRL